MSVRWYVGYSLSYRDTEELIAETGVRVDHSTINRWVIKYVPELEAEFRKQHKCCVASSWRMNETYIKIKGQWTYLYRAVDKEGKTIDFMLSKKRDKSGSKTFFDKAIGLHGAPEKVTIDKSGANKAGLEAVNLELTAPASLDPVSPPILIRQIKYLNNIVEQVHRFIKRITKPMMDFKSFKSALVLSSFMPSLHRFAQEKCACRLDGLLK